MEWTQIGEALIITAGVIITQVAISWRTQSIIMFRLDMLEKKQDKHNDLIQRMVIVEHDVKSLKEKDHSDLK